MSSNKLTTLLYTILHFCIDGICIYTIFNRLYSDDFYRSLAVFFLYNTFAFIFQAFVGLLIDKFKNHKLFLIISIVLTALGGILNFNFIISAIILGLGNAFFHIAGGYHVIKSTKNDIASLGIFVSSGAIGVCLGQRFSGIYILITFIALALICSTIVLFTNVKYEDNNNQLKEKKNSKLKIIFLLLILLVVFIRSFIGKISIINFDTNNIIFLLIAICVALGQALGGIISKYFGIIKTIIISSSISIILLAFLNFNAIGYMIGICLFNFTMPITLYYANIVLKGHEGLAFGLLAMILFPGYLLGMIPFYNIVIIILIIILSILSSLIIILLKRRIIDYDRCYNGSNVYNSN